MPDRKTLTHLRGMHARRYIRALSDKYEAVVEARCSASAGAVLR
jgi:hypothetical protein